MDNGPMWSKDDHGTYWLLFPNKHAHSIEEIREIFSQFGNVMNVTTAGDEKGFRFIQFSSEQEVERAVENLKDHRTVRLLPYRPKNKNNTIKNKQNNNSSSKNQITTDDQRKPYNDNYNRESNSILEKKNSSSSTSSDQFNFVKKLPQKTLSSQTSSSSSIVNPSLVNVNDQRNEVRYLKFEETNVNSSPVYGSCNGSVNSNKDMYDDEIPELVTKKNLSFYKEPRKVILNASEVIVGNIHKDYGSAYILHLFEKYEPIAISYTKMLPNNGLRYCHVYFKSLQDSFKVETEFDKHNLSGKPLIVLRPCELIEEAISQT